MPHADLHVHTTRSDGQLTLDHVSTAARRANVAVVALTDHDRLQPFADPVVTIDGVTVVHGIELRVEASDGQRLDLLGYAIEPTEALTTEVDRIQRNRHHRGRAIVEAVEDHLGIDLDVPIDDGFGRPHVARAIDAHPETAYDYQGAFDDLIGSDGPCYVERVLPSFERGRTLLSEAGTLVSLAHPLRYDDPTRALDRADTLDAVEVYYPYDAEELSSWNEPSLRDGEIGTLTSSTIENDDVLENDNEGENDDGNDDERENDAETTLPREIRHLERAVEQMGLLATGGSDAHDDQLGRAGLSAAAYRRLGFPNGR